jgi:hypothetical protein
MSAENGDVDWTKILRQVGGPQNLSPIATAQVFLLSAMLREERIKREASNDSDKVSSIIRRVSLDSDIGDTNGKD